MKEIIQNTGGDVAIVIYDAPLPPKYFRFSKKFIRILFLVVPLLVGLSLLGLFLWGVGTRLRDAPAPKFPEVVSESDRRTRELEAELRAAQESNQKLTAKLSGQGEAKAQDRPFLLHIKEPYGMQNLTGAKKISLGQFEFTQENGGAVLKVQIINGGQEAKVSGHVIVFMVSDAGILGYPAEVNADPARGVKFSAGETFGVSRLRPTVATFGVAPRGTVRFVVYVFSREGDLLHVHETTPYKAGAKS